MKKNVAFITGNGGKYRTLCSYLEPIGWTVEQIDLPLYEIQSFSLEEICLDKARQSLNNVNPPFITTDGGLFIDSLNDFPGAYTKPAVEKIGCEGLLKLMEGSEDRSCHFEMCLIYVDEGSKTHVFKNMVEGKMAKEIDKNKNEAAWGSVWNIFIPKGGNRTVSAMTDSEYNSLKDRYQSGSAWKDLVSFLKNKYGG
ncbi:MAG: hypothetical protein LBI29_02435 [Rickettsiales bacterium]|jgi:XTP/dITP diphosphohydrolase|nr:hypothetical protein [Rickettsiales bacterium]